MSCNFLMLRLKSFFKNEPKIKYQLALMYRDKYQNTIFYQVCQSSLRLITAESYIELPEDGQQQELPFERPTSRKSITQVSHYQNSNLNFNSRNSHPGDNEGDIKIPNTVQYMSINQKQQLLKQLIQKSYLFIDLTDLFSGEDLQTYQNLVRNQVFQGEQSIVQSILQNPVRKGVRNKLKYFDSEALHLLKDYVDFCTQLIQKLKPVSQQQQLLRRRQFLPRLILQLKAKLQMQFPDQKVNNKFSQLNKLVEEYRKINDIILSTLQKTQKIKIIPKDSHQYAQNFYTYPNISTLVTVIMFMDENFLKAMFERFIQGLQISVGRINEKLNMNEQIFVQRLKQLYFGVKFQPRKSGNQQKTQNLFTYKSNLQKILQGNIEQRFPFFKRSIRTLQTLALQRQPIKSLKIIYELNKTIQKQHTEFISTIMTQESQYENNEPNNGEIRGSQYQTMRTSQKNKKFSFSRETQQIIIEFLLSKKKQKLRFIIANIMMTYFFVHQHMLKDKKGSCLMPFVQIVQKYGFLQNYT